MNVPLLDPTRRWECPACGLQHVTREPRAHVPMHNCKGLAGLTAPFVEVLGAELDRRAARIRPVEREDYIGGEMVRTNAEGRPFQAVLTERADGSNDCHAFAGCAQASSVFT